MVKVRKVDRSLMDKPKKNTADRQLTPAEIEREKRKRQFKHMVADLKGPEDVYEVVLEGDEKPITIRQGLLKAAAELKVEIAVRKSDRGFVVGLLTPERRTNRGRRAAAQKE
jgi:hypothetical protein